MVALLWHQPQPDLYCRHSNLYKLISIENLKTRLRATFKLCKLKQLEIYGWEKGLKWWTNKNHLRSPDPLCRPKWCVRKHFPLISFQSACGKFLVCTHNIQFFFIISWLNGHFIAFVWPKIWNRAVANKSLLKS